MYLMYFNGGAASSAPTLFPDLRSGGYILVSPGRKVHSLHSPLTLLRGSPKSGSFLERFARAPLQAVSRQLAAVPARGSYRVRLQDSAFRLREPASFSPPSFPRKRESTSSRRREPWRAGVAIYPDLVSAVLRTFCRILSYQPSTVRSASSKRMSSGCRATCRSLGISRTRERGGS
jgi:hypothetical protein